MPLLVDSSDDGTLYQIDDDDLDDDGDEGMMETSSEDDQSSMSTEVEENDDVLLDSMAEESWSGENLTCDLPYYEGKLKMSPDFEQQLPRYPSPIDFFRLYFTSELISYIVDQSNLYRIQMNKTKQNPMTEVDFCRLIGFLFYSSVVPLPNKRDYWSSVSRQSMVANAITRDRIMYLLSILHFHDNSTEKFKFEKIGPMLDHFNERSKLIVLPESNLSIDEQMIGYKGTTAPRSYRQFMPNKPTKRGFKVWTRCGVSGFVYKMILHHGESKKIFREQLSLGSSLERTSRRTSKELNNDQIADTERKALLRQYGSSGMVVLDLIKDVQIGSSLFFDNYFASTKLIKKLTDMNYRVTCTLRPNRTEKCPISTEKEFKQQFRGYYEFFVSDDDSLIVVGWKDSKRVLLGSNHIGTEPEVNIQRWDKENRRNIDVTAPQIISKYNQFMGGVDTLDMLVALHPIPFRSKRWYIRIIWRLFDLMVINSWIIMRKQYGNLNDEATSQGPFRLFHFKLQIAQYLLQSPGIPQPPVRPSDSALGDSSSDDEGDQPPRKKPREMTSRVLRSLRYDGTNHWPVFVSNKNNTRCKYEACTAKTYWKCSKCNVHLCIDSRKNCFQEFHRKQ